MREEPSVCKSSFVRSPEGSEALDERKGAMVLISASGMAGGASYTTWTHTYRTLGYCADCWLPSCRHARPVSTRWGKGAEAVGQDGTVVGQNRADRRVLGTRRPQRDLRWLPVSKAPTTTFLVHGEKSSPEALAETIATELGWHTKVPALYEEFPIEAVR